MKTLLKCIALCLAAPALALAELGQNELKVSETYGPAVSEQKISESLVNRTYNFNGLSVTVTFLNGTSQCEVFKRADGAQMTEEQINKILEANANNLSWTAKTSVEKDTREWMIAGSPPSPPASSDEPMVFAVSGKHRTSEGTKMIAVDMLGPDDDSSPASPTPPVLRKAIYKSTATNSTLSVFTAAFERVARREAKNNPPAPAQ